MSVINCLESPQIHVIPVLLKGTQMKVSCRYENTKTETR